MIWGRGSDNHNLSSSLRDSAQCWSHTLGSWIGQFFTQLAKVAREQRAQGGTFDWSGFYYEFFAATFENWQSEWLQLLVQAVVLLGMST